MAPRIAFALAAILLTSGCSRSKPGLDEVQKTAFAVKPAVVRVSAVATGEFRYAAAAIASAERALRSEFTGITPDKVAARVTDFMTKRGIQ